MCYISNLFRPIIKHEQNMISLQKTNSCLLENNTKALGNYEADVNNQMSRKYKEENIRSYLKRFNTLVALMPILRAGFSLLMYKEQLSPVVVFVCDLSVFEIAELMWYQASMRKGSEFEKKHKVEEILLANCCSSEVRVSV